MATRRQVRQSVISLLYAQDFNAINADFIAEFLELKKVRNEQKAFALALYEGVGANLSALDELLKKSLKEFDRLSKVECAILRLSVYELFYTQTDKAVIINEAIELGKQMGNDNSSKLINAVLDSLLKKKGV